MKHNNHVWTGLAVLVACVGCGHAGSTSRGGDGVVAGDSGTPEGVYRRFMLAGLAGDQQAIRPLIVDHEDAEVLWQGAYPQDVARLLAGQYQQMEITRVKSPGKDDGPDKIWLQSSASPIPLAVVKSGGTWKVDAGPIITFRKAAQKAQ